MPPPDLISSIDEQLSQDRVLYQFASQISGQVYTDPTGARKLLLQFQELLNTEGEQGYEVLKLLMLGNLANLDYAFSDAEDLLRQAYAMSIEEGRVALQIEVAGDLSGPLLNLGQIKEAAELLDQARELAEVHESPLKWRIRTREGFMHLHLGANDEALKCFTEAKELMPNLAADPGQAKSAYYAALLFAGLGRVYMQGQELARSIEAYQAVVDLCGEHNMRGRLPYHYLDLGRAYMAADRRQDAVSCFEQTIEVASVQDKHAVAAASANLGYYAYADRRWDAARKRFDEAEHHYRTTGSPAESDLSMVKLWRARMARDRGKHSEAEDALIGSLDYAKAGEDRAQLATVCREIADYYASLRKYEDAYEYRLLFEEIQREVDAEANAKRLSELELRSEVEERRRESQLLKLRAARLQLKALRAQMNPHFIFNALNSIQEFITSQRATEAAAHLAHFARLMRQSLDYSERETITLEEEIDFLTNYLELNRKLRFQDEFTYDISLDDELEEDIIGLPAMLVQPYVENALEHGIRMVDRGHIQLSFSSPPDDDDVLLIVIQDNGVGRKKANAQASLRRSDHKSMGTSITLNRLELLNRGMKESTAVEYEDLVDTDGSAAGTRVTICLPIVWQSV